MTNITVLQSEIDLFLDGAFQVHASVCGGAIDLHGEGGEYLGTLDADEACLEEVVVLLLPGYCGK
tara:strand:+ start:207 stop:401 length:195 start_codon:yes stop_codon:yes gene_type:complete